jgi:hypothetical protein
MITGFFTALLPVIRGVFELLPIQLILAAGVVLALVDFILHLIGGFKHD